MEDITNYMDQNTLFRMVEQYQPLTCSAHEARVKDYSLQLFDFLARYYDLSSEERSLLEASAWLHDIGHKVSAHKHDRHTFSMITKDEGFSFLPVELRSALALIAGGHRKKINKAIAKHNKDEQRTIFRLTAILRVADAIDYYRNDDVKITDISWCKQAVLLTFKGSMLDLIFERIVKKGVLFEEVFAPLCLEAIREDY